MCGKIVDVTVITLLSKKNSVSYVKMNNIHNSDNLIIQYNQVFSLYTLPVMYGLLHVVTFDTFGFFTKHSEVAENIYKNDTSLKTALVTVIWTYI